MITINNQTEKVVVASNRYFSVDIPIGKTVKIQLEQLQGDDRLFFRYLFANGEETVTDYGVKRGGIHGRMYFYWERASIFPLVTSIFVKDSQSLCLKESTVSLRDVLIFKVVRLKKITSTTNEQKEEYMFKDARAKKRFLKLMRICLFFLPLAVILSLYTFYNLFDNAFNLMEKAIMVFFFLGISLAIFQDAYYFFAARKWKVHENVYSNDP